MNGDRMYDLFVAGGVDYAEIARMPLRMMASQIAELRQDARRREGGERDGYGSSREIARAIRDYARSQELSGIADNMADDMASKGDYDDPTLQDVRAYLRSEIRWGAELGQVLPRWIDKTDLAERIAMHLMRSQVDD